MREKELRIALICYGGVSLAVYMHGITREIWHLVRASRDFHENAPTKSKIETVYQELLTTIERTSNTKLRVLSDIIAGSSAGGINGIFLAQAIVTGQSLDPLTDMWLGEADVDKLLDPDARPLSKFSKFWAAPIAWGILRRKGGAIAQTVSEDAKEEVASKLSNFVRARWFEPPFGGATFAGLLLNAFDAMKKSTTTAPLLPHGLPLDLFVTVTDFAGHEHAMRLNSPAFVTETEHRLSISFSTRGNKNGDIAEIPELVFAGRATASFPGAFPPFSVRELDGLLASRNVAWPGRTAFLKRILPQQFASGTAEDTMLIDGSVLANAPFGQAISALRNRPARREVDRRFVYIDPKPGRPSFKPNIGRAANEDDDEQNGPGFFATIFGATSDIPREQPIRDSLEQIETNSTRVERMRVITTAMRGEIDRAIEDTLGKTWFLSSPNRLRLEKWRGIASQRGAESAGFAYPAYGHLKLAGIVDDMVAISKRALPDAAPEFFRQLRESIWAELRRRGLATMVGKKGLGANKNSTSFFKAHDLRYRVRRLRFVARRLAEEVESDAVETGEIDAALTMRTAIYDSLGEFLDRETSEYFGTDFSELAGQGVNDPGPLIDFIERKRNLAELDQTTDERICKALMALAEKQRRTMLLAYLGYELFDIASLPLLQGEGLDEFDPVKVDRISPDEAQTIRKGGADATLKGIEFNNFGAFFSRIYRENDYLWGRLHGADRLIDIVCSTEGLSDAPVAAALSLKKKAFMAIIEEEAPRLTKIAPLIEALRAEITAIPI
jgi:patatin-related protein